MSLQVHDAAPLWVNDGIPAHALISSQHYDFALLVEVETPRVANISDKWHVAHDLEGVRFQREAESFEAETATHANVVCGACAACQCLASPQFAASSGELCQPPTVPATSLTVG